MRRTSLIALLCLAVVSCSKYQEVQSGSEGPEEGISSVTFAVDDQVPTTRATSIHDATVGTNEGDIQILIFSGNNLISYGKNRTSGNSVSLSIRNGNVDCYAVVNGPDMSSVATKSELLGRSVTLLQNTASRMMMVGNVSRSITTDTSIQIPVKRFLAKVEIDRIDAAMTSPALKAQDLTIDDITLLNVVGTTDFSFTGNSSVSYNNRKHSASAADALTFDEVGRKIQTGGKVTAYVTPHYFYCCPSTATGESTPRLSIKATLGSRVYYYTVEIPQPLPNTLYRITNLKITGPGTDNPNDIVKKSSISFTVQVTDWSTGFSKEVIY